MNMTYSGRRRGFTLIELLVVVAIIALLIAILVPSLGLAREQAKRAKGAANMSSAGKGMALYSNANRGGMVLSHRAAYITSGFSFTQRYGFRADFGQNQALPGQALASYLDNGVHAKVWIPAGTDAVNPFDMLMYNNPNNGWSAPNWYDYRLNQGSLWSSRSAVNFSFLFFMGDPGNTAKDSSGNPIVFYYTDQNLTQPYSKFDGNTTNIASANSNVILMQDLAVRDQNGNLQCNWAKGSSVQDGSFNVASGNFQTYTQGFKIVDTESQISGVNALFADNSVEWRSKNSLTPVYCRASTAPGAPVMTMFLADR